MGFKSNYMEIAGAFGDIGVFIPLSLALITISGLSPTSVFVIGGLFYISAGLYYKIPMPVQPLKAVAMIAIASGFGSRMIACAGILMGIILLVLSLSGAITYLSKLFSKPIVKGIQLSIGLLLIKKGVAFVFKEQAQGVFFPLILILSLGLLLISVKNKRFPSSLFLIFLGLIMGLHNTNKFMNFSLGPLNPTITIPSGRELLTAFTLLVVAQLPLTLGNSVFACYETAHDYFKEKAKRVSIRSLPISIGIANLFAGFFTGMPLCHGAGGLTAHYYFGARTGGASIIIGTTYLIMGLVFGKISVEIFSLIPISILGILLIFIGTHHALLIRALKYTHEFLIAIVVGLISFITNNLTIGMSTGIGIQFLLSFKQKNLKSTEKILSNN
jgi:SulP family sulfate permease